MTYDTDEFTVKVTVTKNADGSLNAVKEVTNPVGANIAFQNSYALTAYTTFTPVAGKKLEGRAANAGEFNFEVVQLTKTGSTYTEGSVVSHGVNAESMAGDVGNVVFQPISYTAAGEYYYLIREAEGTNDTITYDKTSKYYLYVKVEDVSSVLVVQDWAYYNTEFTGTPLSSKAAPLTTENLLREVLFTNHYGPGYTTLNPVLTKYFVDADGSTVLKNLSGSAAFPNKEKADAFTAAQKAKREEASV